MKVLNFQECVGSTSSMQSTSKLAFYRTKLHCTSFLESFWWVPKTSSEFLFFSALEHPPLCACEFLFFSFFFPFFYFFVNDFFHFLYLMLPSLLYHLRKKIQTYGETRNGRSKSGKRKNAKSNRETRKKKEVHQFF